jgi:hypothetical protein
MAALSVLVVEDDAMIGDVNASTTVVSIGVDH